MKIKRFLYVILPVLTLVLEALPYGAVCVFATPEQTIRKTYSYFSLLPFGYANFAPMLTALTTCAVAALLTVYVVLGKDSLLKTARILLWVAIGLSFCPLLLGVACYSLVGGLISGALIAEQILLFTVKKGMP